MENTEKIQETMLDNMKNSKMDVTLILNNGHQERGCIAGYDDFVVVLNTHGKKLMFYKHAISTIVAHYPECYA